MKIIKSKEERFNRKKILQDLSKRAKTIARKKDLKVAVIARLLGLHPSTFDVMLRGSMLHNIDSDVLRAQLDDIDAQLPDFVDEKSKITITVLSHGDSGQKNISAIISNEQGAIFTNCVDVAELEGLIKNHVDALKRERRVSNN